MNRKNILIGKIGKSVKFKNVKIETGGDAVPLFYSTLSRMLPDYHFYFCGPNELNKLTKEEYDYMFPNGNMHSVYECDNSREFCFEPIIEKLKNENIKIDYALLFCGMVSLVNVPNFLKKKDGSDYSILNSYKSYCGPYIYTVNELGCPLYVMSEDARYITVNARDLYNREKLVLTQINTELDSYRHVQSKTDLTEKPHHVKCVYSGIEKIFLMGVSNDWKEQIDVERKVNSKGNHCVVISNGCGTKKINSAGNNSSRLPEYKKYVIDNFKGTEYEDTKIYGIWDQHIYDENPQVQMKLLIDMGDELADARYTLVYSQIPGFVTVKPFEMITQGLIPFIHPDYDKYRLFDLPDYIYLKDEKDLLNKMRELDNNPELYRKVLNECMDCIKPEYLDGSYVVNNVMRLVEENEGYSWNNVEGVPQIFNRFSRNMLEK